jgi:hypothetical protein
MRYVDFAIFMKSGDDERGTEEVIRAVYGASVITLWEYLVVVFEQMRKSFIGLKNNYV